MVLKVLRMVLVAAALASPAMAADQFVSVIDDLPLMAGLNEQGQGVEFATPQGRIVEVTATGKVGKAKVIDFYAKTLPQLGWVRAGDARFVREGETLDLIFSETANGLSVRFSLAPSDK